MRDLFSSEADRIAVDSQEEYDRIRSFASQFFPLNDRIELFDGPEPIFDHFGVEIEVTRALDKKVWLKSGGYIVIEQMESLTVVDVNTGKYVGRSSLEETTAKINLEAVKEIVYQLRLRNIGGIIIIDFIDMKSEENREKVYNALVDTLRADRSKTTICKISELGLVEMTREAGPESLGRSLSNACPYCSGGRGHQVEEDDLLRRVPGARAAGPDPLRKAGVALRAPRAGRGAVRRGASLPRDPRAAVRDETRGIPASDKYHIEQYRIEPC